MRITTQVPSLAIATVLAIGFATQPFSFHWKSVGMKTSVAFATAGGGGNSNGDGGGNESGAGKGNGGGRGGVDRQQGSRQKIGWMCWWAECGPLRARRFRVRKRTIAFPETLNRPQVSWYHGAKGDRLLGGRSPNGRESSTSPTRTALALPRSELDPILGNRSTEATQANVAYRRGQQEFQARDPRPFVGAMGANELQENSMLKVRNPIVDLFQNDNYASPLVGRSPTFGVAPLTKQRQTDPADPLMVDDNEVNLIHNCTGRDVTVTVSKSRLFFSGICRSVTLSGSNDNVFVQIANHGKLTVLGEGNVVISSVGPDGQEPIVSSSDRSNTVIQIRSQSDITFPLVSVAATRLASPPTSH